MFKISTVKAMLITLMVLITGATIAKASSSSFVAEMMMKDEKGKITKGPLYFLDSAYRYDFQDHGKNLYLIVKIDEPEGIIVNPEEKLYSRIDKFSMAMAGNVIEVYTVSENFVSQGLYEITSETEEQYQGLKCTKKIYSLKYKQPSGLSKEELKAAEIWISKKHNFPIKIITYHKGQERAKFELKNIKEKKIAPSLLSIPAGFKEVKGGPPSDKSRRKSKQKEWIKQAASAPVLTPPFDKELKKGDIVRVKVKKNYQYVFDMEPVDSENKASHLEFYRFKDGKPIKRGELDYIGKGHVIFSDEKLEGAFGPKELKGADEIVVRVKDVSTRIWGMAIPSDLFKISSTDVKFKLERMDMESYKVPNAEKLRLILKDDPYDGHGSRGEIKFQTRIKEIAKEKFTFNNGDSRYWDLGRFGKVESFFVFIRDGKVRVFFEKASKPKSKQASEASLKGKTSGEQISGIRYGNWEIKQMMVVQGLPKPMPAGKWQMHIDSQNLIPLKIVGSPLCEIKKQRIKGGTKVVFDVICKAGEERYNYQGEVVYDKDRMKGKYTILEVGADGSVYYALEGKRIGD